MSSKPKVEKRRFEDIGTWMLGGEQQEVPEVLRGVFFMDGNPLAEDCMTFQRSVWNAERRRIRIHVYAPLNWTFEDSEKGGSFLKKLSSTKTSLEVRFKDDGLRNAEIVSLKWGLRLVPWFMLQFMMSRGEDSPTGHVWDRRNRLLTRPWSFGAYTLRRVVDGDGKPTPAFGKMLEQLPETCLVIGEGGSES